MELLPVFGNLGPELVMQLADGVGAQAVVLDPGTAGGEISHIAVKQRCAAQGLGYEMAEQGLGLHGCSTLNPMKVCVRGLTPISQTRLAR